MILKDDAIALRMYPFGNTSRIVVWLSRNHGKLATLVKGSQRDRSPFLGQYDLFYTCELLFYAREQRNLHILKECTLLDPRSAFRTDWRACAAASYMAGLLDRAMPFGPAPHGLFQLLEQLLDHLVTRTPGPAFLTRLELLLLQELGLAPNWDACAKCRADLRGGAPPGWIPPMAPSSANPAPPGGGAACRPPPCRPSARSAPASRRPRCRNGFSAKSARFPADCWSITRTWPGRAGRSPSRFSPPVENRRASRLPDPRGRTRLSTTFVYQLIFPGGSGTLEPLMSAKGKSRCWWAMAWATNRWPRWAAGRPLQVADIPNIRRVAGLGQVQLVQTVPAGLAPGSDVANMGLLGYNALDNYTGRAAIEAAGARLPLDPAMSPTGPISSPSPTAKCWIIPPATFPAQRRTN
jgi:recombinational DNA repair protein (RecF pathway)